MLSPLAVHTDLCTVAVSLQLHLVPLTITHHLVPQPHQSLTASKIKSVLKVAVNNLQDAVVHLVLGMHNCRHFVPCSEAKAQTEMPFH